MKHVDLLSPCQGRIEKSISEPCWCCTTENNEVDILAITWSKNFSLIAIWWYCANLETLDMVYDKNFCSYWSLWLETSLGNIPWPVNVAAYCAGCPSLFLESFLHNGGDTHWTAQPAGEMWAQLSGWTVSWELNSGQLWAHLNQRPSSIRQEGGICQERWRPGHPKPQWNEERENLCDVPPWRKGHSWWNCLYLFHGLHFWKVLVVRQKSMPMGRSVKWGLLKQSPILQCLGSWEEPVSRALASVGSSRVRTSPLCFLEEGGTGGMGEKIFQDGKEVSCREYWAGEWEDINMWRTQSGHGTTAFYVNTSG